MYFELHTASAFSFLAGASLPETLVTRAAALGYPAIALLDRDGVYGAPQLYRAAKAAGLRAIVGAELTITHSASEASQPPKAASSRHRRPAARSASSPSSGQQPSKAASSWVLPVLVSSVDGYRNLCRLITRAKSKAAKGESLLTLADLDGHCGGLIALAG